MADVKHPMLEQFRRELDKRDLTERKVADFDKWRHNEKKCTGALKEAADTLWEAYEAVGNKAIRRIDYDRTQPQKQRRDKHPRASGKGGSGAPQRYSAGGGPNRGAADPKVLGEAFHNPYTFIPFPSKAAPRRRPTPLTIDEVEGQSDRLTGVLEIALETLRPLMTCEGEPHSTENGHKHYRALTLGPDVIVPATGVRGALRSLATILAGGTLGYIDDELWLCQGRDAHLGPAGKNTPNYPEKVFLARVVEAGTGSTDGTVELGDTRLMSAEKLGRDIDTARPRPGRRQRPLWAQVTTDGGAQVSDREDGNYPWRVKLSGRPINRKGKREGLFRGNGQRLTLPAELWGDYTGRHRHADFPELRKDDLVWLKATDRRAKSITSAQDIASIQWARWGREGERFLDVVRTRHPQVLPDSFASDGKVDEITDLFGQVPFEEGAAGPFAARVRPDNLVFFDAAPQALDRDVTLAPLAPPHPGCAAFYRDEEDPDRIVNAKLGVRGYKVYRVGDKNDRPWLFEAQGVYNVTGSLEKNHKLKVNKTCDLLRANQKGVLRMAVRGLSMREVTLLLATCAVDWRLGGGKPLGLGLCRVHSVDFVNEEGERTRFLKRNGEQIATLSEPYAEELAKDGQLLERMKLWQASQRPVPRLRYPRAVNQNNNRIQRGGHVWFARHASQRKSSGSVGLEVLWTQGELKERAGNDSIRAQALPLLSSEEEPKDSLYAYDTIALDERRARNNQTFVGKIEPFDRAKHVRGDQRSGGKHAPNRQSRKDTRRRR